MDEYRYSFQIHKYKFEIKIYFNDYKNKTEINFILKLLRTYKNSCMGENFQSKLCYITKNIKVKKIIFL